jgi:hypothetical protein
VCVVASRPEATLHALADEILKYRRAVRLLAKATTCSSETTACAR